MQTWETGFFSSEIQNTISKWQDFFYHLPFPYFSLKPHTYKIKWNSKMRTRAGLCRPREGIIELNPHLLVKIQDLEQTLVHELCHLAVSRRYPWAEPHGMRWKKLMRFCGVAPERCHKLEVTNISRHRRWELKCQCRIHSVSTRIYNKITSGAPYKCLKCESKL